MMWIYWGTNPGGGGVTIITLDIVYNVDILGYKSGGGGGGLL